MNKHRWLAPVACALSLAATISQPLIAQETNSNSTAGTFHTFDSPYEDCDNQIGYPGQFVTGLDAADTVSGYYLECTTQALYGFYRLADGSIHRFHPETHNLQTDLTPGIMTYAMNAGGSIIGLFADATGFNSTGFIRDSFGNYTELPASYVPTAINSAGAVAGYYEDPAEIGHGFVRDTAGNFTLFDAPGNPSLGKVTQTHPTSINSGGDIVGFTFNAKGEQIKILGFLRTSKGDLTVLDPPNSKDPTTVGIADDGSVVGYYFKDLAHADEVAFIYDTQGNYTILTTPYAGTHTTPTAVNSQGMIVGYYYPSNSPNLNTFYRLPDGTFGQFRVPGSQYTYPTAVNAKGDIAGYYYPGPDSGSVDMRLFLWINPNPLTTSATQNENTSVEPAQ